MVIKVLVVDDSSFFRKRIVEVIDLHPQLEVIGQAANGKEAIEKAKELRPDIITMDVEMPEMNGIEATHAISKIIRTKIIMFSSLTKDGARITLEALDKGACDYVLKDTSEWIKDKEQASNAILNKILGVSGLQALPQIKTKSSVQAEKDLGSMKNYVNDKSLNKKTFKERDFNYRRTELIVIGSSTGGPSLLQKTISQLPENFPLPIIIVQHMPASFTPVFAERLNQNSKVTVKEAVDGDTIKPGHVFLAPGGRQVVIDPKNNKRINVIDVENVVNYRPCVDVTMGSAARTWGQKTLGIILTGMGADGTLGANEIRNNGGAIWSQDEASCTVYGMPQSIANLELQNKIITADNLANEIMNIRK